jgi:dsDNA-specific endonuclease/ATPase MutS2
MKTFNVGDQVSVIDDAFDGVVVSSKNDQVTIETSDGFTMTYFVNELIKKHKTKELDDFNRSESLIKKNNDLQLSRKQIELHKKLEKVERGIPEFDLHIEKLVKNKNGLSNFDILTIQMDTAKRHIQFSINNRIPKIVFIHGVGEGILKSELDYLLKNYEQISFRDANYQKYGLGATEVIFKQNLK